MATAGTQLRHHDHGRAQRGWVDDRGNSRTRQMLDVRGQHGIGANIELIRMQDNNTAYQRMLDGEVNYRFVIDMASLQAAA